MIGIIGAMDSEVSFLISRLENKNEAVRGRTVFCSGRLKGKDVVIAKCGIGKVCAAVCTQIMIDVYGAELIINTGVAGGLAAGLRIGDIVIADSLIQHDFNLSLFGYAKGYLPCSGQKDKSVPTEFRADGRAVSALEKAALNIGQRYVKGIIVSGDTFISDNRKKEELISLFGASATEMEGAAVAQAAFLSSVPFAVIRAISDGADDGATVSSDEFEITAAKASSDMVLEFLSVLQ